MIARDIIIKPVITEKSMAGAVDKKYTFRDSCTEFIVLFTAGCYPFLRSRDGRDDLTFQ